MQLTEWRYLGDAINGGAVLGRTWLTRGGIGGRG